MQIEGRVALISGGASGLGEATGRRLAGMGAKISVVDRDQERGEALAAELGDSGTFAACDVTIEDQVVIYANSTILGAITIGARTTIGGNVFLMEDVAPNSFVVSKHPELHIKTSRKSTEGDPSS